MSNKIKIILLLSFVSLIVTSSAQVGSPYSQFGFGNNELKGFEQSKAMGGIGIGLRSSNQLNSLNPASNTAFDSLSIIYAIGLNTGVNKINSTVDELIRTDSKFGYFALGFRGNKYWGSSFGLTPASDVDYTYMYYNGNSENGEVEYYLHGSGGLNKIYWSNSFFVTPNLSLGINASYIFGSINKVATVVFVDDWIYADNTKLERKKNIYDFTFDYGMQYQFNLKKNSKLVLGAVYQNKIKMNSKESILGGTVPNSPDLDDDYYTGIHEGQYGSELKTVTIDTSDIKGTITLPHSFGVGFTYFYNEKLLVGADVYMENWSSIENEDYDASYNNLLSFKGGLEYTPDFNSINYYFKRVQYRIGGHYTQSHLEVRGTRINDYGVSFGLGLPLRNTKSSFNISCEFGQRGTLEQDLLQETYGIISLNISLSDIWFVKRKFK